jgi:WD40 repeat protein
MTGLRPCALGLLFLFVTSVGTGDEKPDSTKLRQKIHVDQYGDPLPAGALARIGTVRFRTGNTIDRVLFSPDGKLLVSVGSEGVHLWDPDTGKCLGFFASWKAMLAKLPKERTETGSWKPSNGKTRAVACGNTVRVFDVATGKELIPIPEHRYQIGFARLSPDGRMVITQNQFNPGYPGQPRVAVAMRLRFWDARTGRQLGNPLESLPYVLDISADGRILATVDEKKGIRIIDLKSGKDIRCIPVKGSNFSASMSPDGKLLALTERKDRGSFFEREEKLGLWDIVSGKHLGNCEGHKGWLWGARFSPNSEFLASIGWADNTVRLWDPPTRQEIHRFNTGKVHVFVMAFSPDSKILAAAAPYRGVIHMWRTALGEEKNFVGKGAYEKEILVQRGVLALAFTPDNKSLITSDNFGKLYLWDVASETVLKEWPAHKFRANHLTISADGKTLLSQGMSTALVWDLESIMQNKR